MYNVPVYWDFFKYYIRVPNSGWNQLEGLHSWSVVPEQLFSFLTCHCKKIFVWLKLLFLYQDKTKNWKKTHDVRAFPLWLYSKRNEKQNITNDKNRKLSRKTRLKLHHNTSSQHNGIPNCLLHINTLWDMQRFFIIDTLSE